MPYLSQAKYTAKYSASFLGVIGVNADALPKKETAASVLKKIVSQHANGDWHLRSKRLPAPPKPKGTKRASPSRGKYQVIVILAEQADFNAVATALRGKTSGPANGALGCFSATVP